MQTDKDFIREVNKNLGGEYDTLLDALEAVYMDGFADETTGDVDWIGHFYRVERWVVVTDNYGFNSVRTFDSVKDAQSYMEEMGSEYGEWEDG